MRKKVRFAKTPVGSSSVSYADFGSYSIQGEGELTGFLSFHSPSGAICAVDGGQHASGSLGGSIQHRVSVKSILRSTAW